MKFFAIIVSVFFAGCANETTSYNANNNLQSGDSKASAIQNNYSITEAVEIVRRFSCVFQPDSSAYQGIGSLKNVPDSVIQAFKVIRHTDTLSHKKYLTVIFLKLYLDHLRCCHQGYELRENAFATIDSIADPLVYEFNLATKMVDTSKSREFINSGIAHTYVEQHRELQSYPEIKQILKYLKPVSDSIRKHLYWSINE